MYFNVIIIYLISSSFVLCSAFFLFKAKEPIWFCYKVCPLYCPDLLHHHGRRRRDVDTSIPYIEDDYPPYHHHDDHTPYEEHEPKTYAFSSRNPYSYPHEDYHEKLHPSYEHGWLHHPKNYEIEYNVKYVFKPIGYTTKKEPMPTTTMPPTTTAKELTGICVACLKKCGYYWNK